MAQKNNIRSIRFSDELAELIDQQAGRTFTEKFENLVTRCVWELPQKEQQLEGLNMQIKEKREQLGRMSMKCDAYRCQLQDMDYRLQQLSTSIARAQELHWENEL